MAYIGKTPQVGNYQKCDALTASATADYTLQVGSSNVSPESVNHMIVSLNGVIQSPTTAYTVSGATLSFASALTTSDTIDFVLLLGNVLDIGTPSDGTISNAKLGTDVISGETDIGGAIADADLFLLDDGAGGTLRKTAASRIKTYVGGGITVADQWRVTANITANADPISSNLERIDTTGQGTIGTAMSESSGIFTFPSTGIYLVSYNAFCSSVAGGDNVAIELKVTTDNSSYATVSTNYDGNDSFNTNSISGNSLIDVTDTSNVKVSFSAVSIDAGSYFYGSTTGTAQNETYFTFIRLGDT
jgi:hypothetical protein